MHTETRSLAIGRATKARFYNYDRNWPYFLRNFIGISRVQRRHDIAEFLSISAVGQQLQLLVHAVLKRFFRVMTVFPIALFFGTGTRQEK
jgi:hypothetical protein